MPGGRRPPTPPPTAGDPIHAILPSPRLGDLPVIPRFIYVLNDTNTKQRVVAMGHGAKVHPWRREP